MDRCNYCRKDSTKINCVDCDRVCYCSNKCMNLDKKAGHAELCELFRRWEKLPMVLAPPGTTCYICLTGDVSPVSKGCACRGENGTGYAHIKCMEDYALSDGLKSARWFMCENCKQQTTGHMDIELAMRRLSATAKTPNTEEHILAKFGFARALITNEILDKVDDLLKETLETAFSGAFDVTWNTVYHGQQILAKHMKMTEKYKEAIVLYRQIIKKTKLPDEDEERLKIEFNLAGALALVGDIRRAKRLYNKIQRVRKTDLGATHALTLNTIGALAGLYANDEEYAKAIKLYQEVYDARRQTLGENHVFTIKSRAKIALTLRHENRDEAEKILREVRELQRRVYGYTVSDVTSPFYLAELISDKPEMLDEAIGLLEECIETDSTQIEFVRTSARELLKKLIMQKIALAKEEFGPDHTSTLNAFEHLVQFYVKTEEYASAVKECGYIYDARVRTVGREDPLTLKARVNLALATKYENRDAAERMLRRIYDIQLKTVGYTEATSETLYHLAELIADKPEALDEAIELLEQSLESTFSQNNPVQTSARELLYKLKRHRLELAVKESKSPPREISGSMRQNPPDAQW